MLEICFQPTQELMSKPIFNKASNNYAEMQYSYLIKLGNLQHPIKLLYLRNIPKFVYDIGFRMLIMDIKLWRQIFFIVLSPEPDLDLSQIFFSWTENWG